MPWSKLALCLDALCLTVGPHAKLLASALCTPISMKTASSACPSRCLSFTGRAAYSTPYSFLLKLLTWVDVMLRLGLDGEAVSVEMCDSSTADSRIPIPKGTAVTMP